MDVATAFAVLGVPSTATKPEIRIAYRAKAKWAHPDAQGSNQAFVQLSAAFDTAYSAAPFAERKDAKPATSKTDFGVVGRASNTGSGWVTDSTIKQPTIVLSDIEPRATKPTEYGPPGLSFDHFLQTQLALVDRN